MNNGGTTEGVGARLRETREEAREIGADIGEIAGDLRLLASKELELVHAEMMQQVQQAIRSLVFALLAASLGFLTVAFLLVGLMFGLNTVMPLWAAALVTAGIVLVVVMVLGVLAMNQIKRLYVMPKRFMKSVREDMIWLRSRMKWNGR
jgi:Flp pilus assembly protein TadB